MKHSFMPPIYDLWFLTNQKIIDENKEKIKSLEKEIKELKSLHPSGIKKLNKYEQNVLKLLKKPMTTKEVAKKLKKSRSWTAFVLNQLEREGKVKENGKKGREVLYERM